MSFDTFFWDVMELVFSFVYFASIFSMQLLLFLLVVTIIFFVQFFTFSALFVTVAIESCSHLVGVFL